MVHISEVAYYPKNDMPELSLRPDEDFSVFYGLEYRPEPGSTEDVIAQRRARAEELLRKLK